MIHVPSWTAGQWRQFAAHWYQIPWAVTLARQCEVAGVETDFAVHGRDQPLTWTVVNGVRLVTGAAVIQKTLS